MEKILSIFVDESGDFGPLKTYSPYYVVTLLFHNQSIDINADIKAFEARLKNYIHGIHAVHTGPLIRRESIYELDLMEERKKLFQVLFNFARKLKIQYTSIKIKKSECLDVIDMTSRISKAIVAEIRSKEIGYTFDRIIVYYDNGQVELTKILTSVFNALYTNVEFRKVKPIDYKLFQVADLICTLELLSAKADSGQFSASEEQFFLNARKFKKDYLKPIRKKRL